MAIIKILDFTFDVDFGSNTASITKFEGTDSVLYLPNTLTLKNPQGNIVEVKVTSIGDKAFYGNKYLVKLVIRKNNYYNYIGVEAFMDCSNLKSFIHNLNLSDSVAYDNYVFKNCINLTDVKLCDTITTIGKGAFESCALNEMNFPENLTKLGAQVFLNCRNLLKIDLSNTSVQNMPIRAFKDCDSLEEVKLNNNITTIPDYAFQGCLRLTKITIPDGITTIGNYAFENCLSLNLELPNSLKKINHGAFENCKSISNLYIPSLTSLGNRVFYGCNFESLSFETSTGFSEMTFYGAVIDKLTIELETSRVTFSEGLIQCVDIQNLSPNSYGGQLINPANTKVLHLPKNLDYFNLNNTNSLKDIYFNFEGRDDSTVLDMGANVGVKNKAINVYVTNLKGWMKQQTYNYELSPKFLYHGGKFYFRETSSEPYQLLTDLTLTDDLRTYYGSLSSESLSVPFYGCNHLKTVKLDNCGRVPRRYFENCINLETVAIKKLNSTTPTPSNVPADGVYIDAYVFNNCYNLKTIFYEDTTYSWDEYFSKLTRYDSTDILYKNLGGNGSNGNLPYYKQNSDGVYETFIPEGVTFTTYCFPQLSTLFSQPIMNLTPITNYQMVLENKQGILSFHKFKTQLVPMYANNNGNYKKGLVWIRTSYKEEENGPIKYKYVQGIPWMRQEDNSYKVIESFG